MVRDACAIACAALSHAVRPFTGRRCPMVPSPGTLTSWYGCLDVLALTFSTCSRCVLGRRTTSGRGRGQVRRGG